MTPQVAPRVVALPGPATAITGDGSGTVYLAARGGYLVVDLAAGHTARVDVADAAHVDFTAIARRADGKLVLGSADGAVYTLASDGPPAGRHRHPHQRSSPASMPLRHKEIQPSCWIADRLR